MSYAFYFDSSSCSGCKACQVACKDKHGLEVGLLWRRVYEVSGGTGWRQEGAAWLPDVFAYHLSIACNHCEKPICAEVCPARAIYMRADGIVLIDPARCLGCNYCSWVCPYEAPQYDQASGVMTKCTFCADNLDAGLPPACVAACPMRCLEVGDLNALEASNGAAREVAPLISSTLTAPAMLIRPHPMTPRDGQAQVHIANQEEIPQAHSDERSLVLFTILSQTAVGIRLLLALTSWWLTRTANPLTRSLMLGVALLMGTAMLVSLRHLGNPLRAYRSISNWRSSWLSREIIFAALFFVISGIAALAYIMVDAGWFAALLPWPESRSPALRSVNLAAIAAGLALVYSIARVYQQRTIKAWNTSFTLISFFSTTLSLGSLAFAGAFAAGWNPSGRIFPAEATTMRSLLLLSAAAQVVGLVAFYRWARLPEVALLSTGSSPALPQTGLQRAASVRLGLGLAVVVLSCLALTLTPWGNALLLAAFVLALVVETVGRWLFYRSRLPGLS